MRSRISMLHKQLKTTFVYVTHDQTEAMTMGDRIVVMKDGIIQQFDTPQVLYNHPQNIFVAGFIGSPQMNLIDAVIKKNSDNFYAECSGFNIKLPKRMSKYLGEYENKNIIFGIRPENMSISNENSENTIKLHIDIAEMTGADYFLYGNLGDKRIIANVSSNQNIESEKDYFLKLDIDRIHIFDKINERLICD
jgi:multiple sugar transport system ATP-binding protein